MNHIHPAVVIKGHLAKLCYVKLKAWSFPGLNQCVQDKSVVLSGQRLDMDYLRVSFVVVFEVLDMTCEYIYSVSFDELGLLDDRDIQYFTILCANPDPRKY